MMLGALPVKNTDDAPVQTLSDKPILVQPVSQGGGKASGLNPFKMDTDDTMAMIKKYAPYIIAGGIILYLILRNKK